MSAAVTGAAADGRRTERAATPESASRMWRRLWLRWRLWLAIGAVACLVGVFYAVSGHDGDRRVLGPDNAAPEGALAVVRVLAGNGVHVAVPDSLDAALAMAADGAGATLLLHDPESILDAGQLGRLSAAAGRTVLVEPGFEQLRPFTDRIRPAGPVRDGTPSPVEASCAAPFAAQAAGVAAGGRTYTGGSGCYGHARAGGTAHSVASDGRTTVLGHTAFLDNANVLAQGHAALALWTLGAEPTLVWYQPTVTDLATHGTPASPFELLPGWFGPAATWLMLFGVVAVLWRARRDGPLVVEPLPVVVPAAETAEGRARLYQDSRAVAAATASLRSASLTRMSHHLGLGRGATTEMVVATLARAGHRTDAELHRLLRPSAVTTERQLVAWANELHTLEQEIGIP